jgi:hypothetical protein
MSGGTERLRAIIAKCEQYWNEPNICDAEIHAILEFIHREAREAALADSPALASASLAEVIAKYRRLAAETEDPELSDILTDIESAAPATVSYPCGTTASGADVPKDDCPVHGKECWHAHWRELAVEWLDDRIGGKHYSVSDVFTLARLLQRVASAAPVQDRYERICDECGHAYTGLNHECAAPAPSSEAGARLEEAKWWYHKFAWPPEGPRMRGTEVEAIDRIDTLERALAEMPPALPDEELSRIVNNFIDVPCCEPTRFNEFFHALEKHIESRAAVAMNDETPQKLQKAMPPAGQGAPKRG